MTLVNVNFRGKILNISKDLLIFRKNPPQMTVHNVYYNCDRMKLIIFRNFKCRLMGCKNFNTFQPNQIITCKVECQEISIQILSCMSGSVTFSVNQCVNLFKFANYLQNTNIQYLFEPELFPALRITKFNPLCVNVFSSGKCVILGLKKPNPYLIYQISQLINSSGSKYSKNN